MQNLTAFYVKQSLITVFKTPAAWPNPSHINPIQTPAGSLKSISLSPHLCQGLPCGHFPSRFRTTVLYAWLSIYSGRKITASFGNVTVRGEKRWKGQGGSAMANSLSMYSITENIYYSQLSSFAILLQPEPNCCTSYNTRK
jgi:hypothetical protein